MLTPTATEYDHDPDRGHDHDHGHPHAPPPGTVSRRRLLRASTAMAGSLLAGLAPALAQTPPLRHTAEDALGPFFPTSLPADQDSDLTRVAGRTGTAQGRVLYLSGRVLTPQGAPVAGAVIEIWQANTFGRYAHPGDDNPAPLDPDFQGYAKLRADAEGRYQLKTVKPGEYTGRTPHIHFDVHGNKSRLITQMYFEGEARNATDGLLSRRSAATRQSLMSRYVAPTGAQEKAALVAQWDIVLSVG